MKRIFLLLLFLTIFRSANAQLEFYEFGFNVFENNERVSDEVKFKVYYTATERQSGEVHVNSIVKLSSDTSKSYGYDYLFVRSADMLRDFVVDIFIVRNDIDTMNIEINKLKAGAWEMLGMDRVNFSKGNFLITERSWPQNRRDRYMNNRYFPFLDEGFDWEKVRK